MRDGGRRRPGAVADDGVHAAGADDAADVRRGADTDGDGRPDTLLTAEGADLLVLTDLDGDGLADRVLRIGPDAAVHAGDVARPDVVHGAPAAHPDGADAPGPWEVLVALLRPDT
jgi:hypothetical protein